MPPTKIVRAYRSQQEWTALYNAQEGEFKGKRMISAPDVIGASEHASPEALASLQKDCREEGVLTSTYIRYQPYNYQPRHPIHFFGFPYQRYPKTLGGVVVHNHQSTVVSPKVISLDETFLDEIPVLRGESASKVVETSTGLLYLRALENDMDAKPATLLERLVALSQQEPENIALWTPDQESRIEDYEWGRAVVFSSNVHKFHINCDCFDYVRMCSNGVLVNPQS